MSDQATIAELNQGLHQVLDENDALRAELVALRAELGQARGRLDALMTGFSENGTLGVLQAMAHDATLPPEVRIRAAGLAVPFERPKLSVTATTSVPLYDLLEARRQKAKVIEHDPSPPAA
jgi:hypothetical protein